MTRLFLKFSSRFKGKKYEAVQLLFFFKLLYRTAILTDKYDILDRKAVGRYRILQLLTDFNILKTYYDSLTEINLLLLFFFSYLTSLYNDSERQNTK